MRGRHHGGRAGHGQRCGRGHGRFSGQLRAERVHARSGIYNFLQSARLLAEAIVSFNDNCAVGITANKDKMYHNLHNSLMLVTALNPYIGYENAAKTAKKAYKENISLKEACVALGFLTAEKFDEVFHPEQMV